MAGTETTSRHEENNKSDTADVEQLRNALRSKDKLVSDAGTLAKFILHRSF